MYYNQAVNRLAIAFLLSLFLLSLASCVNQTKLPYEAIVDANAKPSHYIHKTLASAISSAPIDATQPYRILLRPGNYYEKLTIEKPYIQLIGSDKNTTRIYYDAYAGQAYAEGKTWGTPGSATLTIKAENILLENITIENTFNYLANDALANDDPERITNAQAVALFIDKGSDKILIKNSRLLGYQDTLFINSGRSWIDNSFIAGNVDFIFGNGNALFTGSEIKTLTRGKPNFPHGYLVAPSTQISEQYGFTFINCRLTRDEKVPDNSVPLGRPWHPTTQFTDGRYADPNAIGKAVFIQSWMDNHITIDGWYSMSGTAKDGTKIPFLPEDARFFEYKSKGPGAQINYKRPQLNDLEIKRYSQEAILGDWKPE
jgi:pectinesterase